jgi:hypothetical protein
MRRQSDEGERVKDSFPFFFDPIGSVPAKRRLVAASFVVSNDSIGGSADDDTGKILVAKVSDCRISD